MKKAKIYTRTGDQGQTGLVGGTRIKKNDPRIHLYGEVDELNSIIGMGISILTEPSQKMFLLNIQSRLFDLGSNLACEKEKRSEFSLPTILDQHVIEIEKEIDLMDESLTPLKNFILPGGKPDAATFHLARTVCRRVERLLIGFEEENNGEIPQIFIKYINRLSDYFFTLSRYLCLKGHGPEIAWIPQKS